MSSEARVSSLDVARRAGVSRSAVSRVFTPGASASAETAAKVRRAAEELGYRPNALARAVITGRSRIIGLIVAYLDNQFYPVALERLSNALQERGYHILIFTAGNRDEDISGILQELIEFQVDGIITASVGMTNDLTRRCAAAGIPVVMFNRGQPGSGLSSVTSANRAGGAKLAEFLVAGGHARIAHVAGWQGSSTGVDRKTGFVDRLAALGREPLDVIDGMYDREITMAATRDLMARPAPPDAIFAGSDHTAFAVMDVLRGELGLDVPGDVSVVGYDDVPIAAWPGYDLTTIRQPVGRMVEATVETLLAQIEAPDRPAQALEIAGDLILRGSARIPEGYGP